MTLLFYIFYHNWGDRCVSSSPAVLGSSVEKVLSGMVHSLFLFSYQPFPPTLLHRKTHISEEVVKKGLSWLLFQRVDLNGRLHQSFLNKRFILLRTVAFFSNTFAFSQSLPYLVFFCVTPLFCFHIPR
jgi:hypothetical protein